MHQFPFVRITWPVVVGIVCCEFYPIPTSYVFVLFTCVFVALWLFVLPGRRWQSFSLQRDTWFGLGVTVSLLAAGYLYATSVKTSPPQWLQNQEVIAKVRLNDAPMAREKSHRVEAQVLQLYDNDSLKATTGKALLYFAKETDCAAWEPGDELILRLRWNRIEGPRNPGEFDLGQYNRRQGIFYRAFVQPEHVLQRVPQHGFSLMTALHRVERYMTGVSAGYFTSPAEKAVADALILGYKDDLDEETVNRFSRSGTSHVLAVSGLHVGILWLILDKLLAFLNRRKATRIGKFVLSLGILWGYATLTGLSPSVLRAAIMFSCFAFSGLLKKDYNSINTLCVSAWLQLLIDPMVLFNAGFQLSYAAVAGILVFYPLIKNGVYFKHKYVRLIWELVALTLAAQLTTLPVSLYWFGQFPTWFAFSNLPIVPLSGLALQLGLAAYVLEWVPYLGETLFHLFVLSIKLMDALAGFFAGLPGAILYFRVDLWDAFLLYAFIVAVTLFLVKKKSFWFKTALLLTCVYLGADAWREWQFSKAQRWVVYALKEGTVIRQQTGRQVYEYRSPAVSRKSYSFSVTPSNRALAVKHQTQVAAENGFITFGNRKMVLLQRQHLKQTLSNPILCDWILVENLRYIDFDMLQQNFRFQKLIITSGNTRKSRRFWKKECLKRLIPFYDVGEAGAFIMENGA